MPNLAILCEMVGFYPFKIWIRWKLVWAQVITDGPLPCLLAPCRKSPNGDGLYTVAIPKSNLTSADPLITFDREAVAQTGFVIHLATTLDTEAVGYFLSRVHTPCFGLQDSISVSQLSIVECQELPGSLLAMLLRSNGLAAEPIADRASTLGHLDSSHVQVYCRLNSIQFLVVGNSRLPGCRYWHCTSLIVARLYRQCHSPKSGLLATI